MATKWSEYYAKRFLPWDTSRPSSQLISYFSSCLLERSHISAAASQLVQQATSAPVIVPPETTSDWINQPSVPVHVCKECHSSKPPAAGSVLELGCGTGASAVWLAKQGFKVTAVDIVPAALEAATATAAAAGLPPDNPSFQIHDVFTLDYSAFGQAFDMVYDCQVYHALVTSHQEAQQQLPQLLFDLLKPGGLLFMLTGNANEPEIGPAVLTGQQLLQPLLGVGFKCVFLRQTRFDSTEHYVQQLEMRPLAWWVLLQRPRES